MMRYTSLGWYERRAEPSTLIQSQPISKVASPLASLVVSHRARCERSGSETRTRRASPTLTTAIARSSIAA